MSVPQIKGTIFVHMTWPVTDRLNRTTAFSQIQTTRLLSQLIFVPTGGALIAINPWIPMMISSVLMVAGFAVAVKFIPETLPLSARGHIENQQLVFLVGNCPKGKDDLRQCMKQQLVEFTDLGSWVIANIRVVLVLFSFLAFFLGAQLSGALLLQYSSRRFGWSFSKVRALMSPHWD